MVGAVVTDPYLEGIMARTDKPDDATHADHAAIDLKACKTKHAAHVVKYKDVTALITAVEAP